MPEKSKAKKLFLSCYSDVLAVALELKNNLEYAFKQSLAIESPLEDMTWGYDWEEFIKLRLADCDGLIMLITPAYAKRAWCIANLIPFWMAGKKVFPVTIGFEDAPTDIFKLVTDKYQTARLEDPDDVEKLLEAIAEFCGASRPDRKYLEGIVSGCSREYSSIIAEESGINVEQDIIAHNRIQECTQMGKQKYFISYTTRTSNDIAWAKWVEWVLREKLNAEPPIMQEYDFMPGENFIERMHNALENSDAVICVLTRDYLESAYCTEEWTSALALDKIIPVRFDDCDPPGLLNPRIYIDLHGLDKDSARNRLIARLQGSSRPVEEPDAPFAAPGEPDFPAPSAPTGSAVMHNLPNRNSYFTGRDNMLLEISTAFQSHSTVSIIGAGGFGKTQIAVEYAYSHVAEYRVIWYLNAESEVQLKDSYREFARVNCGIKDAFEIEYASVKRAVDDWFRNHSQYLLIYDNAEGCPELKGHLPPNREKCHILVISREKPQRIVSKKLDAAVFSADDSVDFLKKRIPIADADVASTEELATELGHLPLALECAASYMEASHYSLADYLELYKKQRDIEYLDLPPESTEYTKTIRDVWGITFDKIKGEAKGDEQTKAAVQLFRLCAYCASDDIPLQLFIGGREEAPQPLRGCLDPDDIPAHDGIIRKLERYSLVSMRRVGGRPLISVHRLIQEAAIYYFEQNGQNGQNEEWVGCCLKIANSVFHYQYGTRAEFDEFSANMPHAIEIARYAEKYLTDGDSQTRIAHIYNEIGTGLYWQCDYAKALEWHSKALEIREKALGVENLDTADTYNGIAVVYKGQGKYAEALELLYKALAIRKKALDAEHPDIAMTYNNIATVYRSRGDYAKAREWYDKALTIREKVLGAGHPDTAFTYSGIACVYDGQGNYTKALEWYNKALAIREKALGAGHLRTAATYNNIASVYHAQGKYAEALDWYNKALAIREKVLGPKNPDTATMYNNIALVYQGQGDYAEALDLYRKALTIREKMLGAEHPDAEASSKAMRICYEKAGGSKDDFDAWWNERKSTYPAWCE